MKKSILSLILLNFLTGYAWAGTYPEYTGNYIECSEGWCKLTGYLLNKMTLADPERGYYASTTYPGFFGVPDDLIQVNTKKPRILLFSGRPNADPQTTALVKLKPMPYNNRKIDAINNKNYKRTISYSLENVKNLYWIMDKEILLHFKPVKDEIGMYVYEPVEPLSEGLYAFDSGLPRDGEHQGLRLSPIQEGILTHNLKDGVLVFIVGDMNKLGNNIKMTKKTDFQEKNERMESKPVDQSFDEKSSDSVGKSIDNFLKGIFSK